MERYILASETPEPAHRYTRVCQGHSAPDCLTHDMEEAAMERRPYQWRIIAGEPVDDRTVRITVPAGVAAMRLQSDTDLLDYLESIKSRIEASSC